MADLDTVQCLHLTWFIGLARLREGQFSQKLQIIKDKNNYEREFIMTGVKTSFFMVSDLHFIWVDLAPAGRFIIKKG